MKKMLIFNCERSYWKLRCNFQIKICHYRCQLNSFSLVMKPILVSHLDHTPSYIVSGVLYLRPRSAELTEVLQRKKYITQSWKASFRQGHGNQPFCSEGFWIIKLYKTQAGRETWVGLVRQGYLSCLTPPLVSGVVVAPQLVFVGLPLKTIASCLESSYCRCCCFYISTIIAMTFGLIEGLRIPSWICKELSDLFCYFSMDGAQRWECRMVWPGWTPLFALTVSQKSTLEVVFRFCLVMGLNSCFLVHVCQNLYKGAYTKRPRPVPDLDNIDSSEFNTSCTSRSFKKQIWGRIYIQQVIFDHFWPRFALHAEQSKVIRGHMCW